MNAPFEPLVSINIPTYNSASTLRECLEAIKAQTYKTMEVVIIDSYSSDGTAVIARQYGAKFLSANSLAKARQEGINASLGKYIFLVDSDQILEEEAVEKCVRACEEEDYDGVTLFECSKIVRNTFVERTIAYDKLLFHSLHDDHPIHGTAIPRFF